MKKTNLIALIPLMLFLGCHTPIPDVATNIDSFTGERTDLMAENILPHGDKPRELVWLNAVRVFVGQRPEYVLEVQYEASQETGYLDIGPGQTLTLQADDQELRFTGIGSLNTRHADKKRGTVIETALYHVTPGQLEVIAQALEVHVKITGNNGVIVNQFDQDNFKRFRDFVATYIEPQK